MQGFLRVAYGFDRATRVFTGFCRAFTQFLWGVVQQNCL